MPNAASVQARNRPEIRYVWCGPAVLVVDNAGRCGTERLSGLYFRETRYLSEFGLWLNGDEPFPCSSAAAGPHELEYSLIYPPVDSQGGGGSGSGGSGRRGGILFRDLDLELRLRVHPASLEATLRLTNRWNEQADFEIAWSLAADYAALSEAQLGERQQQAPVATTAEPGGVRFRYTHPQLPLETHIRAETRGAGATEWSWSDGRLRSRIRLARQQSAEIVLRARAVDSEDPIDAAGEAEREQRLRVWQERRLRLFAPAETPLVALTNDAMEELGSMALLDGAPDRWMTPSAGMPLYAAVFGRDALTASWQSSMIDGGEMVRDTLATLRSLQGTRDDARRDERPGRIIQQARRDPLARLDQTPFRRYYGDFASPFMFILALGNGYGWSGRKQDLQDNWDAVRRILDWAREHGDRDGDGFLEYLTRSDQGPRHQGWKDSDNAIVYADGSQVEPPIAPCEIQGYYYAALQFAAAYAILLGERRTARDLWRQARELKRRFNEQFWLEDEGCVAFGLDADKRPIRAVTSNAAQCITTGIVDAERLPRLVDRIFEPDLFSGWGVRTLSTRNPAYNPLSYHLGSVWAVENGTILFGLRRFGFDDRAVQLARALYDLGRLWPGGRIPECVGGYARGERSHPGAYPRANAPQAWNRSTWVMLVQTLLGLRPLGALGLLAIDPILPPWLPEITLRGLRVGEARATIRFWRDADGTSHHRVLERTGGTLRIVRQPPLNSLAAGVWDRVGALARGVRG